MPRVLNVIIDLPETAAYHRPTIDAVRHAIDARHADVAVRVVRTTEIDAAFLADPGDGVFIGPGSRTTYRSRPTKSSGPPVNVACRSSLLEADFNMLW